MPAPTKEQIKPIAVALMQQEGLRGENAPDLAGVIAEITAQALILFVNQVQVIPGIPCSPGATVGPGKLM